VTLEKSSASRDATRLLATLLRVVRRLLRRHWHLYADSRVVMLCIVYHDCVLGYCTVTQVELKLITAHFPPYFYLITRVPYQVSDVSDKRHTLS
jgi:hypothetical protein